MTGKFVARVAIIAVLAVLAAKALGKQFGIAPLAEL